MSKLCTAYFVVTFDTARGKDVTSLELIFITLLHLFIFCQTQTSTQANDYSCVSSFAITFCKLYCQKSTLHRSVLFHM